MNVAPDGRCERCPIGPAGRCVGFDVRRFCELLDPACKQHDARYADVVVAESRRSRSTFAPLVSALAHVAPEPCCGGAAPYVE